MKVRVVVARENEEAHIEYIEDSLSAMKEIVGGWIEAAIGADDWVLYVNEEGKINGECLPNRNLSILGLDDIAFGPILITGIGKEGETVSLDMQTAYRLARLLNMLGRELPLKADIVSYLPRNDDEIPDDFKEPENKESENFEELKNSIEDTKESEAK